MEPSISTMDLHTHVHEKKVKARDYWKNARQKKIDVMAITEHAHFDCAKAYRRVFAEKPKTTILIPGAELNTSIGHVLCYAPDERIYEHKKLFEMDAPIEEALDITKAEGLLLSCAHPWGYTHDSAGFLIGPKALAKLIQKYPLGIETYNGMIGHLSDIIYESGWIRRPNNFLDFLQKNRVTRRIGLGKLGEKIKKPFDRAIYSYLNRITASIELGEKAPFITAGSDAHSADRIGEGMIKIKSDSPPETAEDVLEMITQKQNVVWCGIGVKEVRRGVYEKLSPTKIKRMELVDGFKYAAMRSLRERIQRNRKKAKSKRKII